MYPYHCLKPSVAPCTFLFPLLTSYPFPLLLPAGRPPYPPIHSLCECDETWTRCSIKVFTLSHVWLTSRFQRLIKDLIYLMRLPGRCVVYKYKVQFVTSWQKGQWTRNTFYIRRPRRKYGPTPPTLGIVEESNFRNGRCSRISGGRKQSSNQGRNQIHGHHARPGQISYRNDTTNQTREHHFSNRHPGNVLVPRLFRRYLR